MSPVLDRSRVASPRATLTLGAVGVGGDDAAAVTAAASAGPLRGCHVPRGRGVIVASQCNGIFHRSNWVS